MSRLALAGAACALVPLAFGLVPGSEPDRLRWLLWGYGLAGLPYLYVAIRWRSWPTDGLRPLLLVALGGRLALLLLPPLLSEDIWRYVWDGAMHWRGVAPFAHPPDAPALDGVAAGLTGIRDRIGHAHLATIYPPAAQLLFAAAGAITAHPLPLRIALVALDGLVVLALWRWAARTGRPPQLALLYAFLPLAMLESAVGAHVDVLGVAGTVAGGLWLSRARPLRAGLALAVGVGTKLLPLLALPTLIRRAPRAALGLALGVGLLWGPYLAWGEADLGGAGRYAHRWRGNEGAFALVAAPLERRWPRSETPVELSPLAVRGVRALVGQTGDGPWERVFPDELAFALAKAVTVALLLLWWAFLFLRARDLEDFFGPAVVGLLLLSPVVHPWYLLWVTPFAALAIGRGARWGWPILLWAGLAWIAYVPRPGFLATGVWVDTPALRLVQYVPVWLGLALVGRPAVASRSRCGGPESGTC